MGVSGRYGRAQGQRRPEEKAAGVEADPVERRPDQPVRHAVEGGVELQVLAGREVEVDQRIVAQVADLGPRPPGLLGQGVPADGEGARVGPQQGGEHAQEGALAGSVRAQHGEALARREVDAEWDAVVPVQPGRDLTGILTAARDGELGALLVGGVDPADCPDPLLALDALDRNASPKIVADWLALNL